MFKKTDLKLVGMTSFAEILDENIKELRITPFEYHYTNMYRIRTRVGDRYNVYKFNVKDFFANIRPLL